MREYLGLICETCGAGSANLRVTFTDGGRSVVILDQSYRADHPHPTHVIDNSLQLPLSLSDGLSDEHALGFAGNKPQGSATDTAYTVPPALGFDKHGEAWELVAEQPACVSACTQKFPEFSSNGEVWNILTRNGGFDWRFKSVVRGFNIVIDLQLSERQSGFIHRRISKACSFLRTIEAIVSEYAITPECSVLHDLTPLFFDPPFIGRAPSIFELKKQIQLVSDSGIPLLIEGETGTGKEIVARNVHRLSSRRDEPLVIVNCMELPESLLQSELFGHIKGSFTGASRDRVGLIESAKGGTFFLDEIGEMPLSLQAVLLRVLQEKEVRRIGESRHRKVDVNFVFATNRDLTELVKNGKFREDLYFRISGFNLSIPPLRKRREDILLLAQHFLQKQAEALGSPSPQISTGAAHKLLSYNWPGNVRELKHEMERIIALNRGKRIIAGTMLSPYIVESLYDKNARRDETGSSLPAAIERLERRMIGAALERFQGNRTRTALALGITRQGLLKKIKRYGLA